MQADQLQLRLQVVPEAQDARAAARVPLVRDRLELVGVQPAAVELRLQVRVERLGQGELELAVQQRLLAGIQRDGDVVRLGQGAAAACLEGGDLGLDKRNTVSLG